MNQTNFQIVKLGVAELLSQVAKRMLHLGLEMLGVRPAITRGCCRHSCVDAALQCTTERESSHGTIKDIEVGASRRGGEEQAAVAGGCDAGCVGGIRT